MLAGVQVGERQNAVSVGAVRVGLQGTAATAEGAGLAPLELFAVAEAAADVRLGEIDPAAHGPGDGVVRVEGQRALDQLRRPRPLLHFAA